MSSKTKRLSLFLAASRTKKGFTQTFVAQKLGYTSPQFISNWERGLAAPPLKALARLSKLYEFDPEEMISLILKEEEKELRRAFKLKTGA